VPEILQSPDVLTWVEATRAAYARDPAYGAFRHGILWIDQPGPDGEPIGGSDPSGLIDEIRAKGWPLLHSHDPGMPLGKVVAAQAFVSSTGQAFVVGFLGIYTTEKQLSFSGLGIAPDPPGQSPITLPEPRPDWRIEVAYDPREVAQEWVDPSLNDSPLPVKTVRTSHNAESPLLQVISIGLPYAIILWNPLVKAFATEAGKDIYAGVRHCLRKLFARLKELRRPVLCVQFHLRECQVDFLFRGGDPQSVNEALDGLPGAGAKADALIGHLAARGSSASRAVYEFHLGSGGWYPSYVVLLDGRLVSDRDLLIAVEKLPSGLSLGILTR
jgi:hypothetical protein